MNGLVMPSRASDLCQAAQKCGGAGGGECEFPLCRSRRPRSHCPLEKRRFRPAQGQVTHNGTRVNWPNHCCRIPLPSLFGLALFLQIWYPRGPYLEYSSSDVCGWGFLYLRGGKHGWKIGSVCHAHCSRSAWSAIWYVITAILPLLNAKDFLSKTASWSLSKGETSSCSVTNYPGSDVHLAFYPDLDFKIVPRAAVPLKTVQTGRVISWVSFHTF